MSTAESGVNWFTFENAPFNADGFSTVWLAALATYGVGDVVTTIAIVYFVPLATEANPVVRTALETFGLGGFVGLKLLVFYTCLGISIWAGLLDRDRVLFYAPPLLLALMGGVTTVTNLTVML